MDKRKIAVLGGGIGAITAAYAITQLPNWQDDYEITVYQMGWRLGGQRTEPREEWPDRGARPPSVGWQL